MSELFDRYYELQIGDLLITIDDLDIEFTVENDTNNQSGTAEITIFNLSDSSKAKIKKDTPIQLKAGYKDDYGIIFYGTVDKVWDEWQQGDVKTVVQALDATKQLFRGSYMVRTYPAGMPVATIVKDVFSAAGVPVGLIEDPGITLTKTMTFEGSPYQILQTCIGLANGEIVKQRQVSPDLLLLESWTAYVKNNMGYFVRREYKEVEAVVLSSETGLMEVTPQESEDSTIDYRVRCLLQWKASQDSIIKLESIRVSGLFKVVEFKHVCKRDEFYSELGVKAV